MCAIDVMTPSAAITIHNTKTLRLKKNLVHVIGVGDEKDQRPGETGL
jgi:hypothetical protein